MNVGLMTLMGTLAVGGPVHAGAMPGAFPVPGQQPVPAFPHQMKPLPAPAPVLAARVIAPKGVRVTVYPGSPLARMFEAPALLGLRPGYVYRMELSNLPYAPGRVLYPEVEVRGTLVTRPGMKYMDWPTPLLFTQNDIERALGGVVITKAVYLEDPEKAIPSEFGLNAPVELPADTEEEAIKAAIANGRLVAIVRLGNKVPAAEVLKASAIEGTILMPGEKYLRTPALPPTIAYYACPLYDPMLGPKLPTEECFPDGGDKLDRLGIGPFGQIGGLNPTDVGVEFTIAGQRRVTTSNIVCLCVPRFVIQRAELFPSGFDVPVPLAGQVSTQGVIAFSDRVAAMAAIGREKPVGFHNRQRLMAFVGRAGVGFFIGTSKPNVIGQIEGIAITGAVVEPEVLTAYPTLAPLTVSKSVDPDGMVNSGDIVTFTIRYVNTGNRPISDVAVNDSLSGRLEYVVGSAQSDRAANFAVAENESGSVVVRWEMPGVLLPGQGGVVKFKAKVR
jgi:uncharacterized repeat protein (TIGR01451 family)